MGRRLGPVIGIALVALASACGGGGGGAAAGGSGGGDGTAPVAMPQGTPTGDPVTASIGSAGGSLSSADGRLTVVIPAGALAADTEISIQPIGNTAPHGLGRAYRLGPEGQTFAVPVEIVFRYSAADVGVGSPDGLALAFQDAQGFWQGVLAATVDAAAKAVTVSTDHFSDWAAFEWLRLDPASAAVKVRTAAALTVLSCVQEESEDLLVALVPTCHPFSLHPLIQAPAVNGVPGGDATAGTVTKDLAVLTYTAPSQAPAANPVAVSVEVNVPGRTKVVLVSNVEVVDVDAWAGTITMEIVRADPLGTATIRTRADVVLEFDETQGAFLASAGSVASDLRFDSTNRQPPCETTASGTATIAPGEGSLTILEFSSPPEYVVSGGSMLSVTGTSTCNDSNTPQPVPSSQFIAWAAGQGPVEVDGRTIDDTWTTTTSGGGITETTTVRTRLTRTD